MADRDRSLLTGRSTRPLDADDERRITNVCYGFDDREVPFRVAAGENTRFREFLDEGERAGEVVFGEDAFPGPAVADPNASISLHCVVAHEFTHYHRWFDHTELDGAEFIEIDEAITSLEAILRYRQKLNDNQVSQLIRDAIQRLMILANKMNERVNEGEHAR